MVLPDCNVDAPPVVIFELAALDAPSSPTARDVAGDVNRIDATATAENSTSAKSDHETNENGRSMKIQVSYPLWNGSLSQMNVECSSSLPFFLSCNALNRPLIV